MVVVIVVVVIMVVVIVVVVVTALHPLGVLLPVCLHAVHHGQPVGDILARRVQHILHPQLALAAVPDEHIRPAHGDHVQRRGLEAVRLPPGGYQQHRVHRVAADLPHEIVVGEQGAYHLQPPIVRRICLPPAAGRRQQQHRRQQRRRKSPHAPHLLTHSLRQYTTSIGKREVGAFVEAGKKAWQGAVRADRVVRPYKGRRGRRPLHPPNGSALYRSRPPLQTKEPPAGGSFQPYFL